MKWRLQVRWFIVVMGLSVMIVLQRCGLPSVTVDDRSMLSPNDRTLSPDDRPHLLPPVEGERLLPTSDGCDRPLREHVVRLVRTRRQVRPGC